MKVYRYELAFDGESQEVGFFVGLEDIGISGDLKKELIRPFDEKLPMPPISILANYKRTKSYFTEKGMRFFEAEISNLKNVIEEFCYEVLEIEKELTNKDKVVYKDSLQVILESSW